MMLRAGGEASPGDEMTTQWGSPVGNQRAKTSGGGAGEEIGDVPTEGETTDNSSIVCKPLAVRSSSNPKLGVFLVF